MQIIFEFLGGPLDGETVAGRLGEQDDADRYYALTHHGRLGQRFRVASTLAVETLAQQELREDEQHHFQQHSYQVTDCIRTQEEVLIRVQYLEPDSDQPGSGGRWEPVPGPQRETATGAIVRFVDETARTMSESLSHCWPDDAGGQAAWKRNLLVYLGHILLADRFAVLAPVACRGEAELPIDLLGIAPGQDWYLACSFLDQVEWKRLESVREHLDRLQRFRLTEPWALPSCRAHLRALADHCRGYGLLAGCYHVASAAPAQLPPWWEAIRSGGGLSVAGQTGQLLGPATLRRGQEGLLSLLSVSCALPTDQGG